MKKIHMMKGMTEENCWRILKGFFREDGHIDERYKLDAGMLIFFMAHHFWNSVLTGEPIDTTEWFEMGLDEGNRIKQ